MHVQPAGLAVPSCRLGAALRVLSPCLSLYCFALSPSLCQVLYNFTMLAQVALCVLQPVTVCRMQLEEASPC
jgi:hypothetical protein